MGKPDKDTMAGCREGFDIHLSAVYNNESWRYLYSKQIGMDKMLDLNWERYTPVIDLEIDEVKKYF